EPHHFRGHRGGGERYTHRTLREGNEDQVPCGWNPPGSASAAAPNAARHRFPYQNYGRDGHRQAPHSPGWIYTHQPDQGTGGYTRGHGADDFRRGRRDAPSKQEFDH